MSRQHSIVKHPANYFFIPFEDDYLLAYKTLAAQLDPIKEKQGKPLSASSDCKAMMAAVLEGWMNSKRIGATSESDMYIYFTIDEWVQQLRNHYKRSVVLQCINEMEKEGTYTDPETGEEHIGTIKKRPYIQNTYGYILNLPVINTMLDALPAQSPYGLKNRPALGRPKKSGLKIDGIKECSPEINGLKTDGIIEKQSENRPINAKYSLKKDASFYTQNHKTQNHKNTEPESDVVAPQNITHSLTLSPEELSLILSLRNGTPLSLDGGLMTPPFVAETTTRSQGDYAASSIQDESSTSCPTTTPVQNSAESHDNTPHSEIACNDTMLAGFASQQEIEAPIVPEIVKPAIPVMPPVEMKWSPEKLVQITECKRIVKGKTGAYFNDKIVGSSSKSQRQRQLDAAKSIIARKITEQQYIAAYDETNNDWWNAKGSVTVETMQANTPRSVMRVVEVTEKLESKSTSTSQPATSSTFTPHFVSSAPQRPNKTAYTDEEIMKLRRMTTEEVKAFHAQRRANRELLTVGK